MKCIKKRMVFGILLVLLINIILISALGSSSSLGGSINIPMGNQTFPSITTNNNTTNQNSQQNNITNNLNENQTTTSNENTNTQTNSDENNQKSVSDFKKPLANDNQDDNDKEVKTDSSNEKNKSSEAIAEFYNKNNVEIILMINTFGLFLTLITLITYNNSLEEEI